MVTFQTPNPYWRKLINGMKNPFSTGKSFKRAIVYLRHL